MKKKFVLATDFSNPASKAVDFLMSNCDENDKIVLLHVVSNDGFSNPPIEHDEIEREVSAKREELSNLAKKFRCETEVQVIKGNITESISCFARNSAPDLLVMGSHKYGFFDRLLNRDIRKEVLRESPCPILCC